MDTRLVTVVAVAAGLGDTDGGTVILYALTADGTESREASTLILLCQQCRSNRPKEELGIEDYDGSRARYPYRRSQSHNELLVDAVFLLTPPSKTPLNFPLLTLLTLLTNTSSTSCRHCRRLPCGHR